jgi:hypothetical protein
LNTVELRQRIKDALTAVEKLDASSANALLAPIVASGMRVPEVNYLRGAAALIEGQRHLGLQFFLEELRLFPFHHECRQTLLRCLTPQAARELRLPTPDVDFEFPSISYVVAVSDLSEIPALQQALHSLVIQGYPHLEIIIVDATPAGLRLQETQGIKLVAAPGMQTVEALHHGLAQTTGELMGWFYPDCIFREHALFQLAEVFIFRKDIQFITSKRFAYDADLKEITLPCDSQRWSRSHFCNPRNFIDPNVTVLPEGSAWRRELWAAAGSSLSTNLKEAFAFELFARFLRSAHLYTLVADFCGRRSQSTLTNTFITEALAVIKRENAITGRAPLTDTYFPPHVTFPIVPSISVEPTPISRPPLRFNSVGYTPRSNLNVPKITVVTPSFNQGEYLEECIDSVLSQHWSNLEYIILDGGSTDNSAEIIGRYAPYLHYWRSAKDAGQYAALHEGLNRGTGEIMCWLNADDKYHPGAFQRVAETFVNMPEVEWLGGRPTSYNKMGHLKWTMSTVPRYSRAKYLAGQYGEPFIQQESIFWKRSLWQKSGAYIDTTFQLAGDLELWARFFRFAQLWYIDAPLGGYRIQENNRAMLYMHEYLLEANRIVARERALINGGQWTDLLDPPKNIIVQKSEPSAHHEPVH